MIKITLPCKMPSVRAVTVAGVAEPNPWLNISLNDTVADCDKQDIANLKPALLDCLELRTLPEPFHGNPDAPIYLLCGNPNASIEDLNYVGNCGGSPTGVPGILPNGEHLFVNNYERETCLELWHVETEFLWLRRHKTVVDHYGNPYLGYGWWWQHCKSLTMGMCDSDCTIGDMLFAVELFPYHTYDNKVVKKLKTLKSNDYSTALVNRAMQQGKIIVIMRNVNDWEERIPGLACYTNTIKLNSVRNVCMTPDNMVATDWAKLEKCLLMECERKNQKK